MLDDAIDQLGQAPTCSLGSILREPLRNGHSARASRDGSGIRTLTLSAVTNNEFSERFTKMTVATPDRVAKLWLEPGDMLIQRSNTPELVGTSALYSGIPNWAIFPDLLIRARVVDAFLPEYVQLILSGSQARNYMKFSAKGLAGSMPKIDQTTIENITLPAISEPQQRKFVEEVEFLRNGTARLARSVEATFTRQTRLRRAVLSEAFVGRLVEQDPADEPASVLLERIRTERAAQGLARRSLRGLGEMAPQKVALF
jgi:type I restriction enzyme S subunit